MIRLSHRLFYAATGLALALGVAASSDAAVLLNLTSTRNVTGSAVGADVSPGQQVGGIAGSNWNAISGDTSSIIDDDGNALPGVSVDIGSAVSGSTVIDYNGDFSVSNLGDAYNVGVFAGNAQSGLFGSSKSDTKVAVRISGLAAGTYTVYVTGQNTNINGDYYNIYAGAVGSSTGNTDYSGFTSESLDFPSNPDTDDWVDHANYVSMAVTLGADQDLVVVSDGLYSSQDRGFLNTVEVAVPEPASAALLLLGGGGLLMVGRRRRRVQG